MYKLHNNILIVGVLSVGFLAVLMPGRALCMMTAVTLFAFVSQMMLILHFSQEPRASYPSSILFWTVLIYSVLIGSVFMFVSYYYDGDTFLFSKRDAFIYYNAGLRAADIGYLENAQHLIRRYTYEEWGGLLSISFIVYLIPSKFFVNAVYMVLGAVASVMIFRISKQFMPNVYAFCAGLSYGTSSFMILFYCTTLKEPIFVFFVIAAMYFFCMYIEKERFGPLLGVLASLAAVTFFRPAVTAFLTVSFVAYFAIKQRGSAVSVFLSVIIVVGLVASLAFLQDQLDTYTSGDTDKLIQNNSQRDNYTGAFSYFVSWFSAPCGPFPTFFPKEGYSPSTIHFYGAGLLHRIFLIIPFWMGVFFSVKRRNIKAMPLAMFIVTEMFATAYVMASFELRKVLPHIPLMYVLTFYGIYEWDKMDSDSMLKRMVEPFAYMLGIGILILWDVIKVKG